MKSLTVSRNVKISTGSYENTDVAISITEDRDEDITEATQIAQIMSRIDVYLQEKIDIIDNKDVKRRSRAIRFGV